MASLAVGINTLAVEAKAGLLTPLLQWIRPTLEQQLAGECQRLAKEAVDRIDTSTLPLGELVAELDEAVGEETTPRWWSNAAWPLFWAYRPQAFKTFRSTT